MTKVTPSKLCTDCNGRGYKPQPIIVEPGDLKTVNVWCKSCHGQGVIPKEKLAFEIFDEEGFVLFRFDIDDITCIECGKEIIRGNDIPFCEDCPLKRLSK